MTLGGRRPSAPAVAGGAAVLGFIIAAGFLGPEQVAPSAALAGVMAAIAVEDARAFRIPDPLVVLAIVAGLASNALQAWWGGEDQAWTLASGLLHMTLCGGAFFLVREAFYRLRGSDGLGLGDVKLAAAAGVWLGSEPFAFAVLLAAAGALIFVAIRRARDGHWPRQRRVPFGMYLAPAVWVCWLVSRLAPGF